MTKSTRRNCIAIVAILTGWMVYTVVSTEVELVIVVALCNNAEVPFIGIIV